MLEPRIEPDEEESEELEELEEIEEDRRMQEEEHEHMKHHHHLEEEESEEEELEGEEIEEEEDLFEEEEEGSEEEEEDSEEEEEFVEDVEDVDDTNGEESELYIHKRPRVLKKHNRNEEISSFLDRQNTLLGTKQNINMLGAALLFLGLALFLLAQYSGKSKTDPFADRYSKRNI